VTLNGAFTYIPTTPNTRFITTTSSSNHGIIVRRNKALRALASSRRATRGLSSQSDPEVLALEGLAEAPVPRGGVPGGGGAAVAAGDAEGERLADEDGAGLPVLAPVPRHGQPLPGARRLHARAHHVPRAGHVRDQHQVEVPEAVDGEPHAAGLAARHPAF
jgi:hypothetical protein